MKKYVISIPYVYPACPLNIDHAKLFVLADVIARNQQENGREVIFPVASHYSGVAADNIVESFKAIFAKPYKDLAESEKRLLNLYTGYYKTPVSILKAFVNSKDILDFYSQEILWELHLLNISCDYNSYYPTDLVEYSDFVTSVVNRYWDKKLLIKNEKHELALNYSEQTWQDATISQIKNTHFTQQFQQNNILAAIKNVRNDWGILRDKGIGVVYQKKWIIDPMFDSELFTVFDLYRHHLLQNKKLSSVKDTVFEILLTHLSTGNTSKLSLIEKIIADMPCDLFIGEEHLKNWIVKKIYSETALFHPKFRTKHYFIVGMGMLNEVRMSASMGTAILTRDLIHDFDGNVARLSILLCGGHPSKSYNYDKNIPFQAKKMIENFLPYYQYLQSLRYRKSVLSAPDGKMTGLITKLQYNIDTFYFKQSIIDLLITIPKMYPPPDITMPGALIEIIDKYMKILLPGLYLQFNK